MFKNPQSPPPLCPPSSVSLGKCWFIIIFDLIFCAVELLVLALNSCMICFGLQNFIIFDVSELNFLSNLCLYLNIIVCAGFLILELYNTFKRFRIP